MARAPDPKIEQETRVFYEQVTAVKAPDAPVLQVSAWHLSETFGFLYLVHFIGFS